MDTAPSGTAQVDGEALDAQAPPEPEELALAGEFPAADRTAWLALVDQVVRKAGRIPEDARPGEGVDETKPDRVLADDEDNRDRRCCRFGHLSYMIARRRNHADLAVSQIGCQTR